jgi:hypothetical protein
VPIVSGEGDAVRCSVGWVEVDDATGEDGAVGECGEEMNVLMA